MGLFYNLYGAYIYNHFNMGFFFGIATRNYIYTHMFLYGDLLLSPYPFSSAPYEFIKIPQSAT